VVASLAPVQYRELGRSGLTVSRIALGCGNFGGIGSAPAFFGQGETREQAFAILDAARELGITLLDTADAYGGGRSEQWIGDWLGERGGRDGAVVATKVFHSVVGDSADEGLAPGRIRRQIEGSLERLGVDRIDLYLIHAVDEETPLADTLTALDGLVRAGKVAALGASNISAAELEQALAISEARGLARFELVQNSYSLLDRAGQGEVLRLCERHGLGFTPFSPLAGGWLTGKYRPGEPPAEGSRMATRPEPYLHFEDEAVFAGLDALAERARDRGTDTAALALAWLLADERVSAVVVGPRRPEHLDPAVRALDLRLTPTERDELSALFPGL
jgi:aryl-alcohol dehydrogenase-like predicted oxidoreductase